jgi:hypothetical protein
LPRPVSGSAELAAAGNPRSGFSCGEGGARAKGHAEQNVDDQGRRRTRAFGFETDPIARDIRGVAGEPDTRGRGARPVRPALVPLPVRSDITLVI